MTGSVRKTIHQSLVYTTAAAAAAAAAAIASLA